MLLGWISALSKGDSPSRPASIAANRSRSLSSMQGLY